MLGNANPTTPDRHASVSCPECGYVQKMEIPKDRCIPMYICAGCKKLIKAKTCCVFCDYGDRKCPVSVRA